MIEPFDKHSKTHQFHPTTSLHDLIDKVNELVMEHNKLANRFLNLGEEWSDHSNDTNEDIWP